MIIWPFIAKRVYNLHGKDLVWLSRMQRKGLRFHNQAFVPEQTPFWQTHTYNKYIGISFAFGAALFAVASLMQFYTNIRPQLGNLTNIIFFLGSIPFTIAASLQHFQSANTITAPDSTHSVEMPQSIKLIGWHPRNSGWWSTLTQWVGTLAFNISTYNAISTPDAHILVTLEIWAPNLEGSILFLVSGYLAFIEVSNRYWSWQPKNLSWNIVFINLLGCIAFMIAAVAPSALEPLSFKWVVTYSNTYTLLGAICFYIGAILLVRESRQAAS